MEGQRNTNAGEANPAYRHGMWRTPTYKSWSCMIQRCSNPKNTRYKFYGARGIAVCARWKDFSHFLADMGERPSLQHSIDRMDPAGNYEPRNCRWLLKAAQAANRRNSPRVQYLGSMTPLCEIPRPAGLTYKRLWTRIFVDGWAIDRALSERVRG